MPEPISLATIPVIAFIGGLYSGQASRGVTLALIVHTIWVWFYHRGADFDPLYAYDLLLNWFYASLLAGLVGSIMTLAFDWMPIMDGASLSELFRSKDGGRASFRKIGIILGKLILVFLIFSGAHVIYELNVAGFPKWAGGIVASGLIVLGWIAFALLFRSETDIFDAAPLGSTGYHRFTRSEVITYTLFAALTHFIYFTAYWISAWFWPNTVGFLWLADQWYFYMSLILMGGIGVIMVIVALVFLRNREDLINKYKKVPETAGTAMQEARRYAAATHMNSRVTQRPVVGASAAHEADFPINAFSSV